MGHLLFAKKLLSCLDLPPGDSVLSLCGVEQPGSSLGSIRRMRTDASDCCTNRTSHL